MIEKRYNLPGPGKQTDEFLTPIIVKGDNLIKGTHESTQTQLLEWFIDRCIDLSTLGVSDGDTIVFFDFRSDRMREIVETFGVKQNFETDVQPRDLVPALRINAIRKLKFH